MSRVWIWDFLVPALCSITLLAIHLPKYFDFHYCQSTAAGLPGSQAAPKLWEVVGLSTPSYYLQLQQAYPCHTTQIIPKLVYLFAYPHRLFHLLLSIGVQDLDYPVLVPLCFLYTPLYLLPYLFIRRHNKKCIRSTTQHIPAPQAAADASAKSASEQHFVAHVEEEKQSQHLLPQRWLGAYHVSLKTTLYVGFTSLRRVWAVCQLCLRPDWPLPTSVQVYLSSSPMTSLCCSAVWSVPFHLQVMLSLMDSLAYICLSIALAAQQRWPYERAPLGPVYQTAIAILCNALAVYLRYHQHSAVTKKPKLHDSKQHRQLLESVDSAESVTQCYTQKGAQHAKVCVDEQLAEPPVHSVGNDQDVHSSEFLDSLGADLLTTAPRLTFSHSLTAARQVLADAQTDLRQSHLQFSNAGILPAVTKTGSCGSSGKMRLRYMSPVCHKRVVLKLPWAHVEDLPEDWVLLLQEHVARTSQVVMSAVAREGCIALSLHLASPHKPANAQMSPRDELAQILSDTLSSLWTDPSLAPPSNAQLQAWISGQALIAHWDPVSSAWQSGHALDNRSIVGQAIDGHSTSGHVQDAQTPPRQFLNTHWDSVTSAWQIDSPLITSCASAGGPFADMIKTLEAPAIGQGVDTQNGLAPKCQVWPASVATAKRVDSDGSVRLLLYCSQPLDVQQLAVHAQCGQDVLTCHVQPASAVPDHKTVQLSDLDSAPGLACCICVLDVPACGLLQLEVWRADSCLQLLPVLLLPDAEVAEEINCLLGGWQEFCEACKSGEPRFISNQDFILDLGSWLQYFGHAETSSDDSGQKHALPHLLLSVAPYLLGSCLSWGCTATARYILDGLMQQPGYSFQVVAKAVAEMLGSNMLQLAQSSGSSETVQWVLSVGQHHGMYDWRSPQYNNRDPVDNADHVNPAADIVDPQVVTDTAGPAEAAVAGMAKLAVASGSDQPATASATASSSQLSPSQLQPRRAHAAESAVPLPTKGGTSHQNSSTVMPTVLQMCLSGFPDSAVESAYMRFVGQRRIPLMLKYGAVVSSLTVLAALPHLRFDTWGQILINCTEFLLIFSFSLLALVRPRTLMNNWERVNGTMLVSGLLWTLASTMMHVMPRPVGNALCGSFIHAFHWALFVLVHQVRVRISLCVFLPLDLLASAVQLSQPSWLGGSPWLLPTLLARSAFLLCVQLAQEYSNRRAFQLQQLQKQK